MFLGHQNWGKKVALMLLLLCLSIPGFSKSNTDHDKVILRTALWEGVDPALVHAVIRAESNYDHLAVSHANAQGLMQLIPATAERFNVKNSFDPSQNVTGGTKYLRWLLKRFKGDMKLALAGYNAGEGNVDKYNGIPPFKETQNYVKKVMRFYRQNKGLPALKRTHRIAVKKKVKSRLALNRTSKKSAKDLLRNTAVVRKNIKAKLVTISRKNESVITHGSFHRVSSLTASSARSIPQQGYVRITSTRRLQ